MIELTFVLLLVMGGEASSTDKAKKQYFVGSNAMAVRRDGMRVESPMTDGIVTDWDAAEALMEHSYKSCLGADAADHPLLMAEPSFNTASAREKTAELAFEKFGVPAFFLSKNAVLAAFAAGRGTALVLFQLYLICQWIFFSSVIILFNKWLISEKNFHLRRSN